MENLTEKDFGSNADMLEFVYSGTIKTTKPQNTPLCNKVQIL